MNQAIKERWVNALDSGKYKQVRGALHNDKGYCCLGVLCDLYIQEHPDNNWTWEEGRFKFMDECGVLPYTVRKWAGLSVNNPVIQLEDGETSLAGLNDLGRPFEEIAQIIEEQL